MRRRMQTTTWDDFALYVGIETELSRERLHDPDEHVIWRRTAAHEAIRFHETDDPEYQLLARYVIAQAVCDARCDSDGMALIAKRARRWLRAPTGDLTFWCTRAGIDVENLTAWATAQFPRRDDPMPDPAWLASLVRTRRTQPERWDDRCHTDADPGRPDLQPLRKIPGLPGRPRLYPPDMPESQRRLMRAQRKAARNPPPVASSALATIRPDGPCTR